MILQKYIKAEFGIDAIMDSELKVSLPTKLNDPFELLPRDIGVWTKVKVKKFLKDKQRQNRIYEYQKLQGIVKNKREFKNALKDIDEISINLAEKFNSKNNWNQIKEMRNQMSEVIRLISFSSEFACKQDEILLWTHYGDNHTGFKLHYDSNLIQAPQFELKEINYSHKRAEIDYTLEYESKTFTDQIVKAALTKAKCWSYEKEYRLLVDPKFCSAKYVKGNSLLFTKIPMHSLIRIDLGLDCDSKYIEDMQELRKMRSFSNTSFYKAELNKNNYEIDYHEIK